MVTWPGVQFCAGHGFSYNPLADQAGAARVQPGNRYYCCEAVDWSEYCDTGVGSKEKFKLNDFLDIT